MRILSSEAMAAIDRHAIDEVGVPGMVLMENAAIGLADAIGRSYPEATQVAIFCGPGNNGGDGLALGRHLLVRGYGVDLYLVTEGKELSGDSRTQAEICRRIGLEPEEVAADAPFEPLLARAARADLVVDALFGTGLGRGLEGRWAELVRGLDRLPVPRVAVDLPSGLSGSRSDLFGPAMRADLTVTFAAPKLAHVFPPASNLVGELVVADLGVPIDLLDRPADEPPLQLVTPEIAASWWVPRQNDSHKGDHGHLLVVAGARGKAGAAILAARGAVRAGAGLVTVAVPASVAETVDLGSIESMTVGLPERDGALDAEAADAVVEAVRTAAEGKDAIALGPGLGQGEALGAMIRELVLGADLPLVLDADGINAFAGRASALAGRTAPTVLTPHPGELGRLLGVDTAAVVEDRLGMARRAAEETGAVVVVKGHRTVTAAPDGAAWVNTTGNPGMASGGSGDVLTGIVGALLGQRYEPSVAAALGVHVHGLAGDLGAAQKGECGLAASDLVDHLPLALRHLSDL